MTAKRRIRATVSFSAIALMLSSIPANAAYLSHKIRQGDTLSHLAKKHHTTSQAIARASEINVNATLRIGKVLRIPTAQSPNKASSPRDVATQPGSTVHTKVNNVCLRSGGSTSYTKIAVLRMGSTGKVLARKGSWIKVALGDGTCGYIYGPLLSSGTGSISYSRSSPVPKYPGASSSDNASLIQTALSCRGARYRRGGMSRGGFDCSGFTRYVFARYGVSLPHSSRAQASVGKRVSKAALRPGDLVFFHTYTRGISHVGIYIGNGKFVHAARHGRGVRVDLLNSGYYSARYRGARRVK